MGINIPATLPLAILEFSAGLIKVLTKEKVDFGIKMPSTLSFSILDQVLMVMVDVDIGLIAAILPPITQLGVVYLWFSLLLLVLFTKVFMMIREVYISLIPSTFLPITTVDNTVSHWGPINKRFLGVGED